MTILHAIQYRTTFMSSIGPPNDHDLQTHVHAFRMCQLDHRQKRLSSVSPVDLHPFIKLHIYGNIVYRYKESDIYVCCIAYRKMRCDRSSRQLERYHCPSAAFEYLIFTSVLAPSSVLGLSPSICARNAIQAFWHTICLFISYVNGSPPGGQKASA